MFLSLTLTSDTIRWQNFSTGDHKSSQYKPCALCYLILQQQKLSSRENMADLTFSKKERQCDLGVLARGQPWRLSQRQNRYSPQRSHNRRHQTPIRAIYLITYFCVSQKEKLLGCSFWMHQKGMKKNRRIGMLETGSVPTYTDKKRWIFVCKETKKSA